MPKRLTASQRVEILDKVFKEGQKVASVCRLYGISRFTFYAWAKQAKANSATGKAVLQQRILRGKKHPRAISWKNEKLILDLALKNPEWSSHKISNYLAGFGEGQHRVSNHGVQLVLEKHHLNTIGLRKSFAKSLPVSTVFPNKFTKWQKYQILNESDNAGRRNVAAICRRFHISRYTYYAWLKKYRSQKTVSSLADNRPRGNQHFRYVGDKIRQHVISVVTASPSASAHQIHRQLAGIASHHAIQNLLSREGLGTIAKRLVFVRTLPSFAPVYVAPIYVPVEPMFKLRMLLAPFVTVPKLLVSDTKKGIFFGGLLTLSSFAFIFWLKFLLVGGLPPMGIFLASVALFFGLFFFLYSLSYYLSTITVLKLTQSRLGGGANG